MSSGLGTGGSVAGETGTDAPLRRSVAANGYWGNLYTQNSTVPMTQALAIATGCTAGATESVVVTPFELVKIRLQDKHSTYKGPMDVVMQTIRKDGPLGLYSGMEATFWRHFWWNGGYFGSIFQIRALLPKAEVRDAGGTTGRRKTDEKHAHRPRAASS